MNICWNFDAFEGLQSAIYPLSSSHALEILFVKEYRTVEI